MAKFDIIRISKRKLSIEASSLEDALSRAADYNFGRGVEVCAHYEPDDSIDVSALELCDNCGQHCDPDDLEECINPWLQDIEGVEEVGKFCRACLHAMVDDT